MANKKNQQPQSIYPLMRMLDNGLQNVNLILAKMHERGYKVFFKFQDSDPFIDNQPLVLARVYKKEVVPPHERGKNAKQDIQRTVKKKARNTKGLGNNRR